MENLDSSNISLLGLLFTCVLCALLFLLPRRYAIAPIIISACFMTLGQNLVIFGLHFTVMRILIFTGLARIFLRGEYRSITAHKLDKLIVGWLLISLVINTLLWRTTGALVYRLGFTYNAMGLYFIFRSIIRDMTDVLSAIRISTFATILLAFPMTMEYITGKNIFSVFGGVPENTVIRDGYLRCQGPFRHPILAGTFGATQAVLILSLWFEKSFSRPMIILGFISALFITFVSRSSGPLLAMGTALFACLLWPLRKNMRIVRWGLLLSIILLHLAMKAPVWYIFAKMSDLVGGGGWHRSYLIDQAVSHFGEWWLLGTTYTAHWMPYALEINPNMADITNQYLLEGVNGGIVTMILFISIIVSAFGTIGISRQNISTFNQNYEKIIWLLGASLFSHVISFISVPYFDQMIVFWYLLLASIATLSMSDKKASENLSIPVVTQ